MPKTLLRWLAGLIGILALLLIARQAGGLLPRFAEWLAGLGPAAPLVFAAVYLAATVLLVPGSLLTLAGGALFGVLRGTVIVLVAATLGASAAFLIARYLARERVARRVQRDERFAAIDRAIGASGLKIVVLLRLSPVVPFNLLNYALGITSVRFVDYLIGCAAMLPGTLLYVYYGRVIGDIAALAGGARPARGPSYYIFLGVGLLATILVTALLTRLARRELARRAPDAV
jgi:uncharacterized membrane protein YdjX (TVP38/TMEM64 family)